MIERAIRNHILADAAIRAIAGRRLYAGRFPEKRALPALSLLIHNEGGEPLLSGGAVALNMATAEISAWADGGEKNGQIQARELGDLFRARLHGNRFERDGFNVSFTGIESAMAYFDNDLNLHRDLVIFKIAYRPA